MVPFALPIIKDNSSPAKVSGKQKLAMVGTGSRGKGMWGKSLIDSYSDHLEFVGLCDANLKRADVVRTQMGLDVPLYHSSEFSKMIHEQKPDAVIVTTTDCFHAPYTKKALELGCNVISEKPLVTNEQQAQEILDAEKKSGKKITTTFNARFGASSEEIKKVISSGVLGKIISVEFQEYLDTDHGASYFRRWHGKKRYSGSLLVHKASHHFDQINWWIEDDPDIVFANGRVAFYGKNNAFRHRNCRECPFASKCDFYWDITKDQGMMDLYVSCEKEDGYLRDGCVWDNEIDTYDSMTVEVKYKSGILLSYSLNAFMPYEGQRIAFNCEKGRLDVRNFHRQPWEVKHSAEFRLTENFKKTKTWTVQSGEGGHGGSDEKLKDLIFLQGKPDPLGQLANSRAGVMSSLIGIAAGKAIENGQPVKIDDLVKFPLTWGW
ncbi:MAG: Gfo/Idh/MocA family oxidoreductase [Cyclobacteriaceae bacterium]|nr:Gfo/Idh/MocA family oxidoreductase [Cyclobacteriaceae bacterium]